MATYGHRNSFVMYMRWQNQRSVISRYVDAKSNAANANVLSPAHQNERIQFSDFYHPYCQPLMRVRFENCDLMGPCSVMFADILPNFEACGFLECNAVMVREGVPVSTAIALHNCQFINCRSFRITFVFVKKSYDTLSEQVQAMLPIITYSDERFVVVTVKKRLVPRGDLSTRGWGAMRGWLMLNFLLQGEGRFS